MLYQQAPGPTLPIMMISRHASAVRLAVVATLVTSMLIAAGPAEAAKAPVRTTIAAHVAPATALVRSTALVSGTVTPKGGTLLLQRLVAKSWVTVAHQKSSKAGTFAFSLRAPKVAASWPLRVVRAATKATKAGVSTTVKLHVVSTAYAVAAVPVASTVTAPDGVTVAGAVIPPAHGSVQLQALSGKTWHTLATARLTTASTFSITTAQPAGTLRLRVVRPYTASIATGTSAPFSVTVQPAVAAPTITTVALPQARVGRLYYAPLIASGGVAPYTWSASGLPLGVTLSAAGALSGTPTVRGTASITATVTDAAAHSVTAALALTVAPQQGYLVGWGYNSTSALGNGTATNATTAVPVSGMSAVVSVAAGGDFGSAVLADGTVWSWGHNADGQLGNGTMLSSTTPVQTIGLSAITAIAAGAGHGLAVRGDGTVWAWGSNLYGQLGDGTAISRPTPVQVPGLTSVVAVAAGFFSSYALRSDGSVWSWGYNAYGQLGLGDLSNTSTPHQIIGLTGITSVAAGERFALALGSDGVASGWGDNTYGQLGDGTMTSHTSPVRATELVAVKSLSAGDATGYAVTSTNTLEAWGYGSDGELGDGTMSPSSAAPVAVHTLSSVSSASGSDVGALALLADGSAWSWGLNTLGELGDGTVTQRTEPVRVVGLTHVLQLVSSSVSLSGYAIIGT